MIIQDENSPLLSIFLKEFYLGSFFRQILRSYFKSKNQFSAEFEFIGLKMFTCKTYYTFMTSTF